MAEDYGCYGFINIKYLRKKDEGEFLKLLIAKHRIMWNTHLTIKEI